MSPLKCGKGFGTPLAPSRIKRRILPKGRNLNIWRRKLDNLFFRRIVLGGRLWSLDWPRNKCKFLNIRWRSQFGQIFSISVTQFVFTSTLTQIWEKHSHFTLLWKKTGSFVFSGQKAEILRAEQIVGVGLVTCWHTELSSACSSPLVWTTTTTTTTATATTRTATLALVWANVLSPCHNTQSPLANTSCLLTRLHIMKTKSRTRIFAFFTWSTWFAAQEEIANFKTGFYA